ncbi:MAG: tetratricopeptide repeat protein, partial [Verrucomicrobiota bacterium]
MAECIVCLHAAPAPIALGCSCRAHAGHAHVECMARFARATGEWRDCRTCLRSFTGRMLVGLSEARWLRARRLPKHDLERIAATRYLAAGHSERGQYTEALRLAREARDAASAHGPAHLASLSAATELANIMQLSGSPGAIDEAVVIHEGVVATRLATLGAAHRETLTARANLASCLSERGSPGDLRRAEQTQREMIEEETRVLGARHVSTLTTHCDLALTLASLRKYDEARAVYERLMPILATELGP